MQFYKVTYRFQWTLGFKKKRERLTFDSTESDAKESLVAKVKKSFASRLYQNDFFDWLLYIHVNKVIETILADEKR